MEESKEEKKSGKNKVQSRDKFYVCCIDESEYVNIFNHKTSQNSGIGGFQIKIKNTEGDIPDEIRDKDLFGMGYPYYVCMYGNKVACSTDYGVCLLEIKGDNPIL